MSEPSIHAATLDDVPAMTAILNDAIVNSTAVWYDAPKSEAEMAAWLQSKERDGFPVLVARNAPRVVAGYASYGPFRPWPGYALTAEHSVYVAEAARGRGLGTALLRALIDQATAAGMHILVGGIESENAASLALHRRLGFSETGRLPEVGRKFDRWLTLVLMQKTLG